MTAKLTKIGQAVRHGSIHVDNLALAVCANGRYIVVGDDGHGEIILTKPASANDAAHTCLYLCGLPADTDDGRETARLIAQAAPNDCAT